MEMKLTRAPVQHSYCITSKISKQMSVPSNLLTLIASTVAQQITYPTS